MNEPMAVYWSFLHHQIQVTTHELFFAEISHRQLKSMRLVNWQLYHTPILYLRQFDSLFVD